MGITIVLLWLLSPLGGQSSLRLLDIVEDNFVHQSPIHYFNASVTPCSSALDVSETARIDVPIVASLVQASLLQSVDALKSPVDIWNNIRIPRHQQLSPFTDPIPENPWVTIDATNNHTWTSLSGLMIQPLPTDGVSTFAIESTYLDFSCPDNDRVAYSNSTEQRMRSGLYLNPSTSPKSPFNITAVGLNAGRLGSYSRSFMDTYCTTCLNNVRKNLISESLNVLYVSKESSPTPIDSKTPQLWYNMFNCSLGVAGVESNVTCRGGACAVRSMRRLELPGTPFSFPFNYFEVSNLVTDIPIIAGKPQYGSDGSPVDYYLQGSQSPLQVTVDENGGFPGLTNFTDIPGSVFAQQMTALVKTVWQVSIAPFSIALGSSANLTGRAVANMLVATNTTITVTYQFPIYSANTPFIVILLLISLLLQACAVWGLILKYTATAPDILGYVSNMTRDNPYVNVPRGVDTLDGLERARLLARMEVQLADVARNKDEGRVVLRSLDDDDGHHRVTGRLSKKKLYA